MNAVGAVFRHELRLLLYAPLSYLFQIGFLAALAAAIFLIADFYSTDEASVRLMGTFLPWVALILVPALAMRSWPDEHSDRSVELAMTLPVRPGALVLGKFLAGYAVLLVTLSFTFPFAVTVAYLGEPDFGVIAAAYLAAAFMLGVYYALSLYAAALVREPIGAFVVSVSGLFLLLLLGWDVFARLLKQSVSATVIDTLSLYSPYTWATRMGQGLIDLGGLYFFAAVTAVALWATARVTAGRREGPMTAARGIAAAMNTFAVLAALAISIPLLVRVPGGIDLTAAREFTLHRGTVEVVERVPAGTEVTLYWSANEASVPATLKSHARRVRTLLRNMAAQAGGRITVREVDPQPDSDEELKALGNGVRRIPMSSGDSFFLGITLSQGGRTANIPYLDVRRDRLTEYDIALALNGLGRAETPKVGILSPLIPSSVAEGNREGLSFLAEMKRAFDLAVIPHFTKEFPEDLDVLVVMDATILRTDMLYQIDQFVMSGGGLIVMIDPHVRFNRASNTVTPQPSEEINDISDLLQRWGVRYQGGEVIGDMSAASVVADRHQQRLSYPYWMRLRQDSFAAAHPVTASLNEVLMVEPGAFEALDPSRVTPLVMTGTGSGALERSVFADGLPRELSQAFKPDQQPRTLAAALTGPFESAFTGPPEGRDAAGHKKASAGNPIIFAVADVDWMFDPFSLQTTNIDGRVIVRPLNDNLNLLLNMVEYAGGDKSLISIRSRGNAQRTFTRVAHLFQEAEKAVRAEEAGLSKRVNALEQRLAAALKSAGTDDISKVPDALKEDVIKFRGELIEGRRNLRDLRHGIRSEVDALGQRLTLINLLSGPLLTCLFAYVVFRHRRSSARSAASPAA